MVRENPIFPLFEPAADRALTLMSERRIAEIVRQADRRKHWLDYLMKVRLGEKIGIRGVDVCADRPG
jgi:hypothetical protein